MCPGWTLHGYGGESGTPPQAQPKHLKVLDLKDLDAALGGHIGGQFGGHLRPLGVINAC